jgi:predicted transcriptional regulator
MDELDGLIGNTLSLETAAPQRRKAALRVKQRVPGAYVVRTPASIMQTQREPDGRQTRRAILSCIAQAGGLHKSCLTRLCGIGWGNLGHHLNLLRRAGLVELETHGRLTWVFDPATPAAQRRRIVATRSRKAALILEAIQARPARIPELCQSMGFSRKMVAVHLAVLLRYGLVKQDPGGRPAYSAT